MIRGHQHRTASFRHRLAQPAEAGVNGLDGFHGGVEVACVADHIRVGIIDENEIEGPGSNGRDEFIGDFRRRHFRLQIIGCDIG